MAFFLIHIKMKTQPSQMLTIRRNEMDRRRGRSPQKSFAWYRWEMSLEALIDAHSKIEAFWKFRGHFLIICFQYINLQFFHHLHELVREALALKIFLASLLTSATSGTRDGWGKEHQKWQEISRTNGFQVEE